MPNHHFFSWVRDGAASAVSQVDPQTGQLPPRAVIALDMTVSNDGGSTEQAAVSVHLYGPGDVTGFDPRMVIRTEPAHLANDFEPNYFAFIEFDRPDFPWLFTPAAADSKRRLTPWLCLLVLEKEQHEVMFDPQKPLPWIEAAPGSLPDPEDAWAWAHAQAVYDSAGGETPTAVLGTDPARNGSRLICPRRLAAKTSYIACVVPIFNAGVQAGLGDKQVDSVTQLAFAWQPGGTQTVQLPVYYHWEFSTSEDGDFEALVRRLQHVRMDDPRIGTRYVSVQAPGWPEGLELPLEGALRVPTNDGDQETPLESLQTDADYKAFQNALAQLLNDTSLPEELTLPPPIYGRWHAAVELLPASQERTWINELNLDLSYRAAAAAGVRVVREQQEQLMAAAWEQAGDIREANRKLRQAQFARTAATLLYQQHLLTLDPASLIVIAGPVLSRVRDGSQTVSEVIRHSVVPLAVTQSAFRRLTSSRGPLAGRMARRNLYWASHLLRRINGSIKVNNETLPQLQLDVPPRVPGGAVTMDAVQIYSDMQFCELDAVSLVERAAATPLAGYNRVEIIFKPNADPAVLLDSVSIVAEELRVLLERIDPTDTKRAAARDALVRARSAADSLAIELAAGQTDPNRVIPPALRLFFCVWLAQALFADKDLLEEIVPIWKEVQDVVEIRDANKPFFDLVWALAQHQDGLERCTIQSEPAPPLDVEHVHEVLLAALEPNATITRRTHALVQAPHWQPADALEPIMAAPKFLRPTYLPLAEQSQEYILPGLQHIPTNSVALLETNPAFVEAYMVGLNHEMGRELLWRGYPTDQRGTYFYQFWDTRTRVPVPQDPAGVRDIDPIADATGGWTGKLGSHLAGTGAGQLVLLLRGDLLRRYPRTVIYLAEAKPGAAEPSRDAGKEKHPLFQVKLQPDVTLLVFDVLPETARGDPGYFVIFQEPPTEPRFGLDETAPQKETGTWRDLSWEHTSVAGGAFLTSTAALHIPNQPQLAYQPQNASPKWDGEVTSAKLAAIVLQLPFRIAIHASDLLRASHS